MSPNSRHFMSIAKSLKANTHIQNRILWILIRTKKEKSFLKRFYNKKEWYPFLFHSQVLNYVTLSTDTEIIQILIFNYFCSEDLQQNKVRDYPIFNFLRKIIRLPYLECYFMTPMNKLGLQKNAKCISWFVY